MNFNEIDEATRAADSLTKLTGKRGRKRKNSLVSVDDSKDESKGNSAMNRKNGLEDKDKESGCRTGRWTNEEMAFCDKLIYLFKEGQLPLAAGVKLNDFLASMVKSKQSRLTKKMKNAKLSSNTYAPSSGHILNLDLCATFSSMEESFFHAIVDPKERAELKFHMRKEWREMFSSYCLATGQSLDADAWLSSVEEMDRRVARTKGASRMARRKLMMGYALCQDYKCAEAGVFIERTSAEIAAAENNEPLRPFSSDMQFHPSETDEFLALLNDETPLDRSNGYVTASTATGANSSCESEFEIVGKSSILHNSPFLNKVMSYIKRHNVPFEHVDVWVPNLNGADGGPDADTSKCRLGFAGSATAESVIPSAGKGPAEVVDSDTKFNLLAFGDYSQKFSFAVNCGLPGRVFHSGIPIWEEDVHLAPNSHFERSGAAAQWGIKTVVGVPLPSPNVGRIVVVLYSSHSRKEDQNLVMKLQDEFAKLLPTPKWKLVVDMSFPTISSISTKAQSPAPSSTKVEQSSTRGSSMEGMRNGNAIHEIVTLLGEEMPSDCTSMSTSHVQALTSLRLLLLRSSRSSKEEETVRTIIGSYSSYSGSGRPRSEIALMLTRDFNFLMETSHHQVSHIPHPGESTQQAALISNHSSHSLPPILHHQHNFQGGVGQQAMHGYHGPMQSIPTPFPAPSPSSDDVLSGNNIKNTSQPTVMEMSMSFFPIPHGTDFNLDQSFRADSPVLTAIEPMGLPGPMGAVGDSLSIVSN